MDFEFGAHGPYVWAAYAASAAVLVALVADTLLRTRRWRREAERTRGGDR